MYATGDKYRDTTQPFGLEQLQRHLAGVETWAVTLDHDGLTFLGAIDVERDDPAEGRAAVLRGLDEARRRGLRAYAILVSTPGGHNGGHIWFPYADANGGLVSAADVRPQLLDLDQAAELARPGSPAEVWPCKQVIRLPFGYHLRAQTRGELVTQDGERFDLNDPAQLAEALATVQALTPNPAPPVAPAIEQPPKRAAQPVQLAMPSESSDERPTVPQLIARFNQEHPLDQLVEQYGAVKVPGGYSCPCGIAHTHDVTLCISKYGKLFSYSPRCHWYTGKGWDSFGLYTLVDHHGDRRAALRALGWEPRERQQRYDGAELPPVDQQARAQDAARKRQSRRDDADATLADVRARLAADEALPERATVVCMLLLELAGDRDWCRPSIARIVDMTGFSERTVHRAFEDLEGRYITSEGKGGPKGSTRIRTFLRVPASTAVSAVVAPEIIQACSDLSTESSRACEGGATSPAAVVPAPSAVPDPEPVAVAFEGGASYNPADDWTVIGIQRPTGIRIDELEAYRRYCQRLFSGTVADQAPAEPSPPATPDDPLVEAAPAAPEQAKRYYAQLGASAKFARDGKHKQAYRLRQQAAQLAEWVPRSVDQARRAAREAAKATGAPSQAPVADGAVPPQLSLWALADVPASIPSASTLITNLYARRERVQPVPSP